jgi:hypothetical protein
MISVSTRAPSALRLIAAVAAALLTRPGTVRPRPGTRPRGPA